MALSVIGSANRVTYFFGRGTRGSKVAQFHSLATELATLLPWHDTTLSSGRRNFHASHHREAIRKGLMGDEVIFIGLMCMWLWIMYPNWIDICQPAGDNLQYSNLDQATFTKETAVWLNIPRTSPYKLGPRCYTVHSIHWLELIDC